jgi:hypothetical protein
LPPIPDVKFDFGEVLKTSLRNPVVALKVIMYLAIIGIEFMTTYFVARSSPTVAIPNSILAISVIVACGIAFMYFDILYAYKKRRR